MHRQSFQIPMQVVAFFLFLCVESHQLPAFGEDGTLVGDLWAGAGGSVAVAVGLVLLDLSEHLDVAGKRLLWPLVTTSSPFCCWHPEDWETRF